MPSTINRSLAGTCSIAIPKYLTSFLIGILYRIKRSEWFWTGRSSHFSESKCNSASVKNRQQFQGSKPYYRYHTVSRTNCPLTAGSPPAHVRRAYHRRICSPSSEKLVTSAESQREPIARRVVCRSRGGNATKFGLFLWAAQPEDGAPVPRLGACARSASQSSKLGNFNCGAHFEHQDSKAPQDGIPGGGSLRIKPHVGQ